MDELEFCVKSLSYPLGMVLENLERGEGQRAGIRGKTLVLPKAPFPARCYLAALVLFESLDAVDRKRLSDDYQKLEEFRAKILSSKLGELVGEHFRDPWMYLGSRDFLAVDWLEFERREERVGPYLRRLKVLKKEAKDRKEFLEKSGFLGELSVDDALLLGYLAEDEKFRELINAALGKHNPRFKEMVVKYFRALRP